MQSIHVAWFCVLTEVFACVFFASLFLLIFYVFGVCCLICSCMCFVFDGQTKNKHTNHDLKLSKKGPSILWFLDLRNLANDLGSLLAFLFWLSLTCFSVVCFSVYVVVFLCTSLTDKNIELRCVSILVQIIIQYVLFDLFG